MIYLPYSTFIGGIYVQNGMVWVDAGEWSDGDKTDKVVLRHRLTIRK